MPKLNLNIDVRPMASNDGPFDYLTNMLRKRSSKCMTSEEESTLRKRSSKASEKSKTLSDKALKKQAKKEKAPKKEK